MNKFISFCLLPLFSMLLLNTKITGQSSRQTISIYSVNSCQVNSLIIHQCIGQSSIINKVNNSSITGFVQPVLFSNQISKPTYDLISIWPNPASNYLRIDLKGINDIWLNFDILDVIGKKVISFNGSVIQDFLDVDISQLNQGSYTIVIQINNDLFYEKFIKLYF